MQRLVSSYNPLFYVLLLALALLLRWPQFSTSHITNEEALLLAAGQRVANGAVLYSETWIDQPPVLPWVYAGAVTLFGDGALLAVRMLALVLMLVCALLLLVLYQLYRMAVQGKAWIALLYVIALSLPWYALGLTREWLLLPPMLLVVYRLLVDYERGGRSGWKYIAVTGILCGFCVCIDYRAILFFPAAVVMQLLLRPLRSSELMTFLIGAIAVPVAVLLVLLFQQSLADATEVSFGGAWGRMWSGSVTAPLTHPVRSLVEAVIVWGPVMFLGAAGAVQLRARYFSLPIRVRKANAVMVTWLGTLLAMVLMAAGNWQVQHFVLLLPPLVFFAAYLLEYSVKPKWQFPLVGVLLLPAVHAFVLLQFASEAAPHPYVRRLDASNRLPQLQRELEGPGQLAAVRQLMQALPDTATLWSTAADYDLYARLNRRCGAKYLDLAPTRRLLQTDPRTAGGWAFGRETLPEAYASFQRERPDAIYDASGIFGELRSRVPSLQAAYLPQTCGTATCYLRAGTANTVAQQQ